MTHKILKASGLALLAGLFMASSIYALEDESGEGATSAVAGRAVVDVTDIYPDASSSRSVYVNSRGSERAPVELYPNKGSSRLVYGK